MKTDLKAIDLFAGAGGFTEGAAEAGVAVIWAANHWAAAVDTHRWNHPDTEHVCQDLQQADWRCVPAMDLVLASPACQGHTKARGIERLHHDACRSTAWAVVSCCEFWKPRGFVVENVPEFVQWSLFPAWKAAMEALGYHVTMQVLDAADTGVPQHRLRVFVVGSLHGPIHVEAGTGPHRSARGIIDFAAGKWSQVTKPGRAEATLERCRNGATEYGEQFVFSYYGNTKGGRSIHRPIGTITTRDRWAVVDGDRMRMFSVAECRKAMGFRDDYKLPRNHKAAVHMLGNAVPPALAAHVIRQVTRALAG